MEDGGWRKTKDSIRPPPSYFKKGPRYFFKILCYDALWIKNFPWYKLYKKELLAPFIPGN
jgi:hypothetical protein